MSYTIDIYKEKLKPTKNFLGFALFVAYFPQLVAGPIERARNLLPQILSPRKLTIGKFYEGSYLIFWGLFQKVFVADNLAKIVDSIFAGKQPYNGVIVLWASYAFAFQALCDFSGYSNIARGLGKCMGFDIMVNFNLPYFATNPREFWRRWHISLSSWLRDYLYIPLGGNRKGTFMTYRNLAITMFLGGLWHGAAWTYVIWGVYQGTLLILYKLFEPLFKKNSFSKNALIEKAWFLLKVVFFFHLICLGMLMFRASSMTQIYHMLRSLCFNFNMTNAIGIQKIVLNIIFFTFILILMQVIQFCKKDQLFILKSTPIMRLLFYIICFYLVVIYGVSNGQEFIYFQF
ncbi:MAG: MBOAT family O-acyltransferase [Candidatus Omnitrophota bacterium]